MVESVVLLGALKRRPRASQLILQRGNTRLLSPFFLASPLRFTLCAPPSLPFGLSIVTLSGAGISTARAVNFSLITSGPFGFFSGITGCDGILLTATFAILFGGSGTLGSRVDRLVPAVVDVLPKPAGRGNPDLITDGGGCAGEGKTLVNLLLLFRWMDGGN